MAWTLLLVIEREEKNEEKEKRKAFRGYLRHVRE